LLRCCNKAAAECENANRINNLIRARERTALLAAVAPGESRL